MEVEDDQTGNLARLVVGIGASAGGLEAFQAFFERMPIDSSLIFILLQHLDPTSESALASLLAASTKMPVRTAADGMVLAMNHVYVAPPNAILTIKDGTIHLEKPAHDSARRTSVNTFLTSLAEDQQENAVGIILSGYGSDGALGMAAIKEHGGLTLSQAEFDHHAKAGMPQSAASGGFVDHVLAVEDMPAALMHYRTHRTAFDTAKGPNGIRQDLSDQLARVCAVLHSRLGRDFSQYKSGTLSRRIQRRMHVLQIEQIADYIEKLRGLPHEAEMLFRELLIGVTRFFRDPVAFEALESLVIPSLLASGTGDPIRIWTAGCATGEEAYSLGILFKEALARAAHPRQIQIFATDIDERSIEVARAGLYPESIVSDLTPERLERHFVLENGRYRIARDLREMCLFSVHDLNTDPPFSKLDLIVCRNLLIYFEAPLQQRVLTTFHYALRPGRHLFLGPSESIAVQSRLFTPIDKRHRLYTRRDTPPNYPALPAARSTEGAKPAQRRAAPPADDLDRRAARTIARYAPAYLVVDAQHEVLRFSGRTAKFLEPSTGVASLGLFSLLHADLRGPVRTALKQVVATGARVLHDNVRFETDGHDEAVNLIVEPLYESEESNLFVVVFQEALAPMVPDILNTARGVRDDSEIRALETELSNTRDRLRKTSEELEAANEELQSSNEEYLSVNEELQSANEELETSKEELQSLNEELQTINAELNHRNESLVRSNSDLSNLFDSTSIATLFLDKEIRIRRFTPRFAEIFKVREGDEGRPISDIATRLTRGDLAEDVQKVLRTLEPLEREVSVETGIAYLMQIRPYQTPSKIVDGTVVTFVDISERKRAERERSRLAAIVDSSQDAIISHDLNGAITSWNWGAQQLFDYAAAEAIGQPVDMLLDANDGPRWDDVVARLRRHETVPRFDGVWIAKGGRKAEVSITVSPVQEGNDRLVGASIVARDISLRLAAERKAALLLGELDHRVKNILAIVSAVVAQSSHADLSAEAFAAEVGGRIQAIAAAHGLLTDSGQGEVTLLKLISTELAPYGRQGGNIVINGPEITLTPRAALSLAMAFHELVSNAAKYGALSALDGFLEIDWSVIDSEGVRKLVIRWAETGGPTVKIPTRRGFGTTLIERSLNHELDAKVKRDFLPTGVRCTVELPLGIDIGHAVSGFA